MISLKIPPLSNRLHEGFKSKNQWLGNYYQLRKELEGFSNASEVINTYLNKIGKNSSKLASKYRGCFLGLAIGDALGTTLEFSQRQDEELHTSITGGGPFDLEAGEWTDDTSMALCIAHSMYTKKSFLLDDQMEHFVAWWKDGLLSSNGRCFDIGNTVSSALSRYLQDKNSRAGSTDEYSAGNGSLMRLAPVPLFFASDPAEAIEKSGESSLTTHGNEQAVDSCRYYAALIIGALKGQSKEAILSSEFCPIPDYWNHFPLCKEVSNVAKGSFKNKDRSQISSTGYVIDSLEAALWAFYSTNSFESGLIKAVNLGGDSDSVGAIYGQLAGAFYGELEIPFKFIAPIKNFHYFYFFADEFLALYDGREDLLSLQR